MVACVSYCWCFLMVVRDCVLVDQFLLLGRCDDVEVAVE